MFRSARFTQDDRFRLTLTRWIDPNCNAKCCEGGPTQTPGYLAWVMNNPSTADGYTDDATIRKIWRKTRIMGFNAMHVANTNPYRSTDPTKAMMITEDEAQVNDLWLQSIHRASAITICAWGDKANDTLAGRTVRLLQPMGPLWCLRETKSGNPQHPLYLPDVTMPKPWTPTKWSN